MSYSVYVDVYVKKRNGNWETKLFSREMSFLKNLCSTDTTNKFCDFALRLNWDEDLKKCAQNIEVYSEEFVGLVEKEDFPFDKAKRLGESSYLLASEIAGGLPKVGGNAKNKEDLIQVFVPVTSYRDFGGDFYSLDDLERIQNKIDAEYNQAFESKLNVDKLRCSMEYLTLDDEKKESFEEEYSALCEDLETITLAMKANLKAMGVLELFDDIDVQEVAMLVRYE